MAHSAWRETSAKTPGMATQFPAPPDWLCRDQRLSFAEGPAIMGILNVTPDSFSDGGQFVDAAAAVQRGMAMVAEGATILDVGGESSRPGAASVSLEEEERRVIPVVRELARQCGALISVDTTKAAVAEQALAAGAHIINDISALTADPGMPEVARRHRAGVVLMHMQGTPRTMQEQPVYADVVAEVSRYLADRVGALTEAGLARAQLAVDPGIGFGKTVEHNVELLRGIPALLRLGRPVLIGVSRKSFLGRLTGREVSDRLVPSLAALAYAVQQGVHIMRVHDVKESCEMVGLLAKFRRPTEPPAT